MKNLSMTAILAVITTMSFNIMAQTKLDKSIVLNKSVNDGNATVAIGKENIASTGSINIKKSTVKNSIVLNDSVNKGNATVAIGNGNTVSTGSITIE